MQAMFGHVAAAGAGDGCDFRFDRLSAAPNTADAHRLVLLARDAGPPDDGARELRVADALFRAYFHEGRHVGERAVLVDVAAEAGLDRAWAEAQLAGDARAADVAQSQREAARLGIQGVPFVVLDDRLGVSGAQPVDVFERALLAALGEAPVDAIAGGAR
jgi:predicted DsbA family dithiol-disulfide isomerase